MKIFISIVLFTSLFTQGCRKDYGEPVMGAEAVDYITGQPLDQAKVIGVTYNSCGSWVIGYCGQYDTLLGYTNAAGRFDDWRLITGYGSSDLVIRKENYFPAGRFRDCVYEHKKFDNTNLEKFHLFRIASFKVTATEKKTYDYPFPFLMVLPVLRNGLLPIMSGDGRFRQFDFMAQSKPTFDAGGAGDLTNRVLVLKRYDLSSKIDTLYKADIYLPAGTVKEISIIY